MAGFLERSRGRGAWADQLAEKFISTLARLVPSPVTPTILCSFGMEAITRSSRLDEPYPLSIPLSYAQSVCRAVDAYSLPPLSDRAATANALRNGSSIKPDLFDH